MLKSFLLYPSPLSRRKKKKKNRIRPRLFIFEDLVQHDDVGMIHCLELATVLARNTSYKLSVSKINDL